MAGRDEVAGELYWIACGYEENENGPEAMRMYERIVQDFPESDEADRAVLDIQRRVITDLINAGDVNGAEALMDEFVYVFKDNPYAGTCLGRVAIGYYKKGLELKFEERQYEEAKEYFQRAGKTFERIAANELIVVTDEVYLYFYSAISYHELARWEDAINTYQKILDKWPRYEYACGIQAAIAGCYESLRDKAGLPKDVANPLIEEAYKAVLTNYPDCRSTDIAPYRLAEISEEKGEIAAALEYYKMFLEKAHPKDNRIEIAEAKLSELEGID